MSEVASKEIVPKLKSIRRIVTGHDGDGNAIILEDRAATQILAIGVPEHGVTDLWKTSTVPTGNDGYTDPCVGKLALPPPPQGTVFRVVEFPPDAEFFSKIDQRSAFSVLGKDAVAALTGRTDVIMHRTPSVDYAIVIDGEIWAVMDKGEVCMKCGDVLIQRGTNHGWSNRTDKPALVAFVMIAAEPLRL
jgi:hypothetical protein